MSDAKSTWEKWKLKDRPYMVHNLIFEVLTEKDLMNIKERALTLMKDRTYDTDIGKLWVEACCWYLENKKGFKLPEEAL